MAFKKLLETLKEAASINFKFIDLQKGITAQGEMIVRLILEDPIPSVQGSGFVRGTNNRRERMQKFNVMSVSIGADTLKFINDTMTEKEPIIEWDEEGKSGLIKSDKLMFDIGSRSQEVFITHQSFAVFGQQQRQATNDATIEAINKQIEEFKAKKVLGNVGTVATGGKPEVVAGSN